MLLEAARPSSHRDSSARRDADFYTRQKKKVDQRLRALEKFFQGLPTGTAPGSSARPREAPLAYFAPEEPTPVAAVASANKTAAKDTRKLRETDSSPALGVPAWFESPDAAANFFVSTGCGDVLPSPDLPTPSSRGAELYDPPQAAACLSEFRRLCEKKIWCDVGDGLLTVPEFLLDGAALLVAKVVPRSRSWRWDTDDGESITSRILDIDLTPGPRRISVDLLNSLIDREQRFFARFEDSYLNTPGFEDGLEDIDRGGLAAEQRKLLWDVARRTYVSKYKFRPEEKIREEAFYFNRWRGVDFVLIPPLIAGYLYARGIEKKVSLGPTELRVAIEPIQKLLNEENVTAGVSADWRVKGWPVGILASAGLYDGNAEMDFIGIGTSIGMAKKVVSFQK